MDSAAAHHSEYVQGVQSQSEEDDRYAHPPAQEQLLEYAFTQHAPDGLLRLEDLPSVLRADGLLEPSEAELRGAMEAVFGGRVDQLQQIGLSFPDVLELRRYLGPQQNDQSTEDGSERYVKRSESRMNCNWMGAFQRFLVRKLKSIEEFFVTMKPTNRLVLVIILISIIMAMAVAGTAIGLNWIQLLKAQNDALRGDMDLVLHAMQEFGFRQIRENSLQNAADTAVILKSVLKSVGHDLNLQTANSTQLNGITVAARLVSDLLDTTTKRWALISAHNMATTLDELCAMDPTFNAIGFVNAMNRLRLREAHEAMLVTNDTSLFISTSTTNNKNTVPEGFVMLTDYRYPNLCPHSGGCDLSLMAPSMQLAMSGVLGSFVSVDYANMPMYVGYSYSSCLRMGVIYKVGHKRLQEAYVNDTVNALNSVNKGYTGSTEVMVQLPEKPGYPLTNLKLAAGSTCVNCTFDQAGYLAVTGAMNGTNPTAIDVDYRNAGEVVATAAKVGFLNAFLVIEIDVAEIGSYVLLPISEASKEINPSFNGSQELLFGYQTVDANGNIGVQPLSDYKWASQCPNQTCQMDPGLYEAVVKCHNDVDVATDYRGKSVVSAQMCIPELNIGAVLKFDESEIFDTTIAHTLQYVNSQNSLETKSSMELMIGMNISNAGVTVPMILSDFKYPDNCHQDSCIRQGQTFAPMVEALKGSTGDMTATDYRGKKVMTAFSYSSSIGLVFKIDSEEVERPLIVNVIIVLFTALGIVMIGNLVLGLAAHKMLASIQATWDKSRQAVQEQKENFESLLAALYPAFVKDRLVAGDVQIFLELSEAAVFFSDICNFTMISNQLTAQELLAWIGYTFGVMDHVANYFAIYKIKTIGDAYLAVAGLPGMIPEDEKDFPCLRMLQFASTCIQLFSGRYTHPDAGACLEMIASKNALLKKKTAADKRKQSNAIGGVASSVFSVSPRGSPRNSANKSQCNMRFGIAAGPLTVGVLQGKCPVFDVWGKTVNLACRMESTGKANCIHVSEMVYLSVLKSPNTAFVFQKPHSTFAKGFGNVTAYFVHSTTENPPKSLLIELALEPDMGDYIFENGGHKDAPATSKSNNTKENGLAVVLNMKDSDGKSSGSGTPATTLPPNGPTDWTSNAMGTVVQDIEMGGGSGAGSATDIVTVVANLPGVPSRILPQRPSARGTNIMMNGGGPMSNRGGR